MCLSVYQSECESVFVSLFFFCACLSMILGVCIFQSVLVGQVSVTAYGFVHVFVEWFMVSTTVTDSFFLFP